MRKLAISLLDEKDYKKSADTVDGFGFALWNYKGAVLLLAVFSGLGATCNDKLDE